MNNSVFYYCQSSWSPQVWNQNGRIPYITYEYTVLRESLPPIPPPPVYTGSDSSGGGVSVEVGGLLAANSSVYDKGPPVSQQNQVLMEPGAPGGAEGQKGQETNEVYEETAAIDCDQDTPASQQYTGRQSVQVCMFLQLSVVTYLNNGF